MVRPKAQAKQVRGALTNWCRRAEEPTCPDKILLITRNLFLVDLLIKQNPGVKVTSKEINLSKDSLLEYTF